jgi:hypothetical protein
MLSSGLIQVEVTGGETDVWSLLHNETRHPKGFKEND